MQWMSGTPANTGQSGLIERVRRSKLIAQDAEQQTLEFLKKNGSIQKAHQCVAIQFAKTAVFYTV